MKTAIMQPYLFPYIGYWQLIYATDVFVLLDDVNFIKRGFINRNSILLNNKAHRFTIPLEKASQNKLILDMKLNFPQKEKDRFLSTILSAYGKAPYFDTAFPMIKEIVCNTEDDLTEYIFHSIRQICAYLDIKKTFLRSSKMEKDNRLKAQDRIIEICKRLGAGEYVNPCGGRALYCPEDFVRHGMKLYFLESRMEQISYLQFEPGSFVPSLSILDMLMFNPAEKIREFLHAYDLKE